MNPDTSLDAAIAFTHWARVFSPLTLEPQRRQAWQALGLPGNFDTLKTEFWSTFHVGNPSPRVPLLLHAALGLEAGSVREDWLRVVHHLGLEWNDVHLPPDQLGVACEVYAVAIRAEESVLISELPRRYLLPWCQFAKRSLGKEGSSLAFIPERFEADLLAVAPH